MLSHGDNHRTLASYEFVHVTQDALQLPKSPLLSGNALVFISDPPRLFSIGDASATTMQPGRLVRVTEKCGPNFATAPPSNCCHMANNTANISGCLGKFQNIVDFNSLSRKHIFKLLEIVIFGMVISYER
jgi:hypothetical protein